MSNGKSKQILLVNEIQKCIYTIRGTQVMLDKDLAELYGVEVRVLNQAVKRNIKRFPKEFMFQLSKNEWINLKSQNVISSSSHGGRRSDPFVFTEQGVSMLSSVLNSETAIEISIKIISSFIQMRRFISLNAEIFERIRKLEDYKEVSSKKLEKILNALEDKNLKPKQGIFYNGQVFDAYVFVAELVKKAKTSIILLDNYIDESVLQIFSKRKKGVGVIIYTKKITNSLKLDIKKFNEQYEAIIIKEFSDSHDRFLIIDNKEVYHFGASLKDLGKKWFGFSKMDIGVAGVIEKLREVGDE